MPHSVWNTLGACLGAADLRVYTEQHKQLEITE
jgi:hypothetical protein